MLFSHKLSCIGKVSPSTDLLHQAEAPLTETEIQKLLAGILSVLPIALQSDRVKTPLTPEFQGHLAQMTALDSSKTDLNMMTKANVLHCKA